MQGSTINDQRFKKKLKLGRAFIDVTVKYDVNASRGGRAIDYKSTFLTASKIYANWQSQHKC